MTTLEAEKPAKRAERPAEPVESVESPDPPDAVPGAAAERERIVRWARLAAIRPGAWSSGSRGPG